MLKCSRTCRTHSSNGTERITIWFSLERGAAWSVEELIDCTCDRTCRNGRVISRLAQGGRGGT